MAVYGPDTSEFFVLFNTKAPCVAERYFFLPARKMWQHLSGAALSYRKGGGSLVQLLASGTPTYGHLAPLTHATRVYTLQLAQSSSLLITRDGIFKPYIINTAKQVNYSGLHLQLPRLFCVEQDHDGKGSL